jgi:hypothetical protein
VIQRATAEPQRAGHQKKCPGQSGDEEQIKTVAIPRNHLYLLSQELRRHPRGFSFCRLRAFSGDPLDAATAQLRTTRRETSINIDSDGPTRRPFCESYCEAKGRRSNLHRKNISCFPEIEDLRFDVFNEHLVANVTPTALHELFNRRRGDAHGCADRDWLQQFGIMEGVD